VSAIAMAGGQIAFYRGSIDGVFKDFQVLQVSRGKEDPKPWSLRA